MIVDSVGGCPLRSRSVSEDRMQQTINVGSYLSVYYAIILLLCNLIGRTNAINPILQSDWPHQDLDAVPRI